VVEHYKRRQVDLPKFTVIVVTKRHHTRFFPTGDYNDNAHISQAAYNGNTINGTVVDRGITEAWRWDFYLQAHAAIKGTAKPAHYVVLRDDIFRDLDKPADAIQKFMHNLCHLYGRATVAVSLCPPVYYADLLAERGRRYLSGLYPPVNRSSPGPPLEFKDTKPSSKAPQAKHDAWEKRKREHDEKHKPAGRLFNYHKVDPYKARTPKPSDHKRVWDSYKKLREEHKVAEARKFHKKIYDELFNNKDAFQLEGRNHFSDYMFYI
jgi:hypothetical protein